MHIETVQIHYNLLIWSCLCIVIHKYIDNNADFLLSGWWGGGLVHNLVPIIPNYNLCNLQNIEDITYYFGL